jgi:hypothetical protein
VSLGGLRYASGVYGVRLGNASRASSHTGIENFPPPRPLKMKVREKLDQAELSISSWDSSELAPHAVDIVAVRAKQKAGQSLREIARGAWVSVLLC